MLTVTNSAKQELKRRLQDSTNDPEASLRLELEPPNQFGLVPGKEAEGDQVIEYEETKVLLVASELAPVVDGTILDVQDTSGGPQLVVTKEKQGNS
jgi:Fe-S cluster assembly iron-binding protein IscA